MLIKPSLQGSIQRRDDKRPDDCSEDRVRSQDRKVDGSGETLTCEFGWSETEVISSKCVMSDIRDQKQSRYRARRDHAEAVLVNPLRQNKEQSAN